MMDTDSGTDDLEDRLARARNQLEKFEQFVGQAISDIYHRDFPPHIAEQLIERDTMNAWPLLEFFDQYRAAQVYDDDRLPELSYQAMDLKLSYYFASRAILGVHNRCLSGSEFTMNDPLKTPSLYLTHMCLMHALIGQSRTLWDRLMGFVYYLEEGKEPEGKSIRRVFFRRVADWGGRWHVFAGWKDRIDDYDNLFRTPEFHKASRFRASIFQDPIDPNQVMALLTPVMNGFWPVLMANIEGKATPILRFGLTFTPRDPEYGMQATPPNNP